MRNVHGIKSLKQAVLVKMGGKDIKYFQKSAWVHLNKSTALMDRVAACTVRPTLFH